jgi:hypothetical protein
MEAQQIKYSALSEAIRSCAGNSYDGDGRHITDPNKIVEAAKLFEAYLKETTNAN